MYLYTYLYLYRYRVRPLTRCWVVLFAYSRSVWRKLQKTCPALANVVFADSDLPMLRVAHEHYERLSVLRDEIGEIYNTLDESEYFPIDLDEPTTRYHPKSLPPAAALPPIGELYDPDDPEPKKIPVQRNLSAITHNVRWVDAFTLTSSTTRSTGRSRRRRRARATPTRAPRSPTARRRALSRPRNLARGSGSRSLTTGRTPRASRRRSCLPPSSAAVASTFPLQRRCRTPSRRQGTR